MEETALVVLLVSVLVCSHTNHPLGFIVTGLALHALVTYLWIGANVCAIILSCLSPSYWRRKRKLTSAVTCAQETQTLGASVTRRSKRS